MKIMLIKILVWLRYHTSNVRLCRWLEKKIAKFDGVFFYSPVIRRLYKDLHGLEIGYGTYGGCWNNAALWWTGIKIGRYCSFAGNVYIGTGNHPLNIFTTHPITYDTWSAGANGKYTFPYQGGSHGIDIGNGVWVGQNAVILSGCKNIGNGAVIGAGAVVTHDVPPYAIVVGNPARVLRYRLTPVQIEKVENSKWWLLDKDELNNRMEELLALTNEGVNE